MAHREFGIMLNLRLSILPDGFLFTRFSFRNSSVGIDVKLRLGLPRNHILRFWQRQDFFIFLFSKALMAALGLTEPPFRDAGSVGLI
jgi:hypothetical protein